MKRHNIKYKFSLLAIGLSSCLTFLLSGCLENDIPYPHLPVAFLTFSAEGEISGAVIDTEAQTVTLTMGEPIDLAKVKVSNYTITEDATISNDLQGSLDLNKPLDVTLTLYYDYKWKIIANQPIERYFTVEGQVGSSTIDYSAKRVVAYIAKSADVKAVKVTSIKLGAADVSTMTPNLDNQTVNFSTPQKIVVTCHGVEETWTLLVRNTEEDIALTSTDAWTNVIWAYANAEEGKANGFEYKKSSDADWTAVPADWVTVSGGSFSACIRHLEPLTSYDVRAVSDELRSGSQTVTTQGYFDLPNASFDNWWKDGKVWCPWVETNEPFWGTGNKGATTLGDSNTFPSDDTWNGEAGYSAELDTKFVGVSVVGKLAAGNLFSGVYKQTDGTNGILDFGRPCKERPTRLCGYWKYNSSTINYTSSEFTQLKGEPDTAYIYVALCDWTAPIEIRTNPKNRQLFNKDADYVIAYGDVVTGKSIENWTKFTAELKYKATNKVPSYILIVNTASKYGDYFTGGAGSTLWVDNFWLEWDY